MRGQLVKQALGCGRLLPHELDQCVREVLKLVQKVMPLGIPENASELTVDTPETSALLRSLSSASLVLLKNDNGVLPFKKNKTTAVMGPNADFAAYCGGGSASLKPYYAVSPLDGLRAQVPDIQYTLGAPGWKKIPLLSRLTKASNGLEGFDMKVFLESPSNKNREMVDSLYVNTTDIFLADYKNRKIESNLFYLELDGTLTPDESSGYEFSLSVSGTGKLFIDGQCVVDNETVQTPGDSFFGSGTVEEIGAINLEKGRAYNVHITFGTLPTRTFTVAGATAFGAGGLRAGGVKKIELKTEIDKAVALAKSVDQVILCAGLNSDWESEGYDRSTMSLPPGTDQLIAAVVTANPNTAIIIQSGTPVTMPWIDEVPSLIHAWYGGNETGNAIADVIFGAVNPSGKLPLSFPRRNEDNPAFLNFRSERGTTRYGEGVYIGYRFYEKCRKEVAFSFGHGLSYTTFKLSSLSLQSTDQEIVVSVDVENTGDLEGAEVVQLYVSQKSPSINRPIKELKGFEKVFLRARQTKTLTIKIPTKYATSFWDEHRNAWIQESGHYDVHVGTSSTETPLSANFEVARTVWWNGL